jgi:hypothetical protein
MATVRSGACHRRLERHTKLPWMALPAGVPAFDAYYDAKTLRPEASLARRRAALGR